jgi:hypothetical protein
VDSVFCAKKAQRRLILHQLWIPREILEEMVVIGIIVHGRNLADQRVAINGIKAVIEIGNQCNGLARAEDHRATGFDLPSNAIA